MERDARLTAYRLRADMGMKVVPAAVDREWMCGTEGGFANRCLPLLIANQSGWYVLAGCRVRITWSGGRRPTDLRIEYPEAAPPILPVVSHFGSAVATWNLPYLFRTSPGYNLLARGPANRPKAHAYALEGVIEADWADSPFTMNWMLTAPHQPVEFAPDEPICMLVPQLRGELESFACVAAPIESDTSVLHGYRAWASVRAQSIDERRSGDGGHSPRFEARYLKGMRADGSVDTRHQRRLRLQTFRECDRPTETLPDTNADQRGGSHDRN